MSPRAENGADRPRASSSDESMFLGGFEYAKLMAILGLALAVDLPDGAPVADEFSSLEQTRLHDLSAPPSSPSESGETGLGPEQLRPTHRALAVPEHPLVEGGPFVIEISGPLPPNARILILESINDFQP